MDWSLLLVLALLAGLFLWRHQKNTERAKAAAERLASDNRLYQQIKTGMREYHWRNQKQEFLGTPSGELLFETAHLKAFRVSHFAELRVSYQNKPHWQAARQAINHACISDECEIQAWRSFRAAAFAEGWLED
jgi:hypothetical protein